MTKSNAQRQAEYRVRHFKNEDSNDQRLNLVIHLHAKCALERLAACYAVTQREVLEGLLRQADHAAVDRASMLPNGQADYYDRRLRFTPESVTP